MTAENSAFWTTWFLAQGHPAPTRLGSGMEGVVYDLGDGLVGYAGFPATLNALTVIKEVFASAGDEAAWAPQASAPDDAGR